MITCPNCGQDNPEGQRFCGNCATPLTAAPAAREQRKTVTVIFCDVTGSTSLGETTDPETLRTLLARYFERMKAIVEAHGGTVEKFIGDAVVAVFGVPQVHEDDALRAIKAALEMREALPVLGIQARIGINTGEVVTGTAERLATGDAVNVAARLQQAAAPQEIYMGRDTYELVEPVVDATAVEPLNVKGKAQPVPAYKLNGLTASPARRNEAAMVGRATELRRLRDAYDQAIGDGSCQLFTVLGSAGVGKSRLVHEFLDGLDATVVRGGCLSYGDGITYWPVVDVVQQLMAARPALKLDDNLGSLMRREQFTPPSEQIAWSFRKLLEDTARDKPLVVVFDDIQWAEPTFLDLIEHVADLSRDAPILLLCMARPDLLDRRSTWAGGKLNATSVLLEPLSAPETAAMVATLVGGLSEHARARVIEAAEGNPLFIEEMIALVRESGDENVRVPPTIQALLAARLDQLDAPEREVLERGSVEGRLFHRGAIEALSPEEPHVSTRLTALVRKDLVRPDKAELPGEDAFRFRHLLIRDAAYDALPKSARADLHERFARWLEEFAAGVPEIDEILGYHLEQACKYRLELGQPVNPELALRARERLARAGRRAHVRGDMNAAESLLRRANELPGDIDVTLASDQIMAALWGAGGAHAMAVAQGYMERAVAADDEAAQLCAQMEIERLRTFIAGAGPARLFALIERATTMFAETGNLGGMYVATFTRGQAFNMLCDVTGVMDSFEAVAKIARRLNIANDFIAPRANWRMLSAEPNSTTIRWLATEAAGYHVMVDEHRAEAMAMAGRFDEARKFLDDELQVAAALAGATPVGSIFGFAGVRVAFLAGDFTAAVAAGTKGLDLLEAAGNTGIASTVAGLLGRAQFYAQLPDDALRAAEHGLEIGAAEDKLTQMICRQVKGMVLAQRGQAADATRLLEEAVELAKSTHSPILLGDAYFDLGTGLALLGRRDQAAAAYREALARYEVKENLAMAERTRTKLAELGAPAG